MIIEAVAFDLDGTLYPDICVYIKSIPMFAFHPRFIYYFNKMRKEIRGVEHIDDFQLKQAELLASKMGVSVEKARSLIDDVIYVKWPRYFNGAKPFPHVRDILFKLKKDEYRLGLLSDFPIQEKLSILGLEDTWDCIMSSDTVSYLKPRPEPFNRLQELLGVSRERILYVGDRYKYDILGAKGAGMLAAHFTKKKIPQTVADFTFSDYRELYEFITNNSR